MKSGTRGLYIEPVRKLKYDGLREGEESNKKAGWLGQLKKA